MLETFISNLFHREFNFLVKVNVNYVDDGKLAVTTAKLIYGCTERYDLKTFSQVSDIISGLIKKQFLENYPELNLTEVKILDFSYLGWY